MATKTTRELSVYWVQPTLTVAYLVLGLFTAVSHHLYYFSLHHDTIYTDGRQQWPIRIGTGLTFLTIALFKMAVSAAYTQYVWTKLRSKTFSLLGIDQLFALTTDATGLFSKEILMRARSVAILALIVWYMCHSISSRILSLICHRLLPIATTIPPATLSVASVVVPFVVRTTVPTLQTNVNRGGWTSDWSKNAMRYWSPTPSVQQLVARAAVDTTMGDIPAFGSNTSYSLTFPGPALKCDDATEIQQALMDHYKNNVTSRFINATEYEQDLDPRVKNCQLVGLPPISLIKEQGLRYIVNVQRQGDSFVDSYLQTGV